MLKLNSVQKGLMMMAYVYTSKPQTYKMFECNYRFKVQFTGYCCLHREELSMILAQQSVSSQAKWFVN